MCLLTYMFLVLLYHRHTLLGWGGIFGEKKPERSCNNEVMLLPILLKAERRPLKTAGGKVTQVCILPPGPPNSGRGLNGAYLLPSPQEL